MERLTLNKILVLFFIIAVTALFFYMIRGFLMAILLAAIFSSLAQPLYKCISHWVKGRKNLASFITIAIIFLIFFIPVGVLLGLVANEAVKISVNVKPWIDNWINQPNAIENLTQSYPQLNFLNNYHNVIIEKAGEFVGKISNVLVSGVSSVTFKTINFVFQFFLFLYATFFFLSDGSNMLKKIVSYIPLPENSMNSILNRFTSVSRAAIKGTLVIGIIQGALQGIAFWIMGIESALFWGTVMAFASIIPVVGTALVWFPAVIILALTGHMIKALILMLFCSLVVGSIDNLLRPWLVGRDTQMHELMILFSTLGGLSLFGIIGFIIGPVIASLFITAWVIYEETFGNGDLT
jgi:predicted PurR-regulated permease PerM